MTQRENFLELIRFGKPERIVSYIPEYSLFYQGCHHTDFEGRGHHSPVGTTWHDIWGTEWHKDLDGVMGFPKGFPLEDLEETLDSFKAPDIDDPKYCGLIYEQRKNFQGGDVFLTGSHRDTLWERGYMLVGMENLMMYFYTDPDLVKRLLHMIMDFQLKAAEHYVKNGAEIIYMGDDMGTQSALLLGRPIIEEFLVPEYRRLFDFYADKNVIIDFHSCGHIEDMLDIFEDLGVDILNPIQSTANNLENIRKKTQGKIALQGGISSEILLRGDKEEIQNEVKTKIRLLGSEGGYICGPDQSMPYTQESLDIMQDAIDKYGRF